jgi:hypothetical protein
LTREAEVVVVAAAHAIYKEHVVLLLDCITVWVWVSKKTWNIAYSRTDMRKKRYSILDRHVLGCGTSLTMRRGMHSSMESYRLGRGMRLTGDTTTNKGVIGVNAGQVVNKNDGAWNAFFEQLDLRK